MVSAPRPIDRLSDAQFRSRYEIDSAEQMPSEALRKHISRRVLIFGADRGLLEILDVVNERGLDIAGIVDPRGTKRRNYEGNRIFVPRDARTLDFDVIVIGSLSPGNTQNLAALAEKHVGDRPVVELAGSGR